MTRARRTLNITMMWAFALVCANSSKAQIAHRPLSANVVVPQVVRTDVRPAGGIETTKVTVNVTIIEQVATTTMDISLRNLSGSRAEAELIVPVPDGAAVRGFAFQGSAAEQTAQLLRANEARRMYDAIVARFRDPALLEFLGCNLIRTSVFPVEPRGTQRVRLTYEHLLPADGNRVDYILPRSESLDYDIPWNLSVRIESARPIATVYSPSHHLDAVRHGRRVVSAGLAADAFMVPGPFRLSYLLEGSGVTASLLTYPDSESDGGYFLLLGGIPPAEPGAKGVSDIKREITLVLDRSGSMNGRKIEQAKEATQQILAGLDDGEAFSIIAYSDSTDTFSSQPVLKNVDSARRAREFVEQITARGGTNIHAALLEALGQRPREGMLPIVLFLTDGLPTVGLTSEVAIRDVALNSNPYRRRVFTFGVGVDVNAPLLDKIAEETCATSTYVLPSEDVEAKVGHVFRRLTGPVLADATLEVAGSNSRVHDVLPATIPDLFEGSQLVVLGKYRGNDPLRFRLRGNFRGTSHTFQYTFDLDRATRGNAFVPRLWASRKIALLIDAIRHLGADRSPNDVRNMVTRNPQLKELVDEIVRLSTRFGILTEYTAFLAKEGTNLTYHDQVLVTASRNFGNRAMSTRSGKGAVNQSANSARMRQQAQLNASNSFWDKSMNRVSITNVQQVNDLAFYSRNGQWVDSRLVDGKGQSSPRRIIEFGSDEFRALAGRLARDNRQGSLALRGDILMTIDGEPVLIRRSSDGSGVK